MSDENNDLHSQIKVTRVISPISQAGNTAMVGAIIDRQGYGSLEFAATLGTVTTGGTAYTFLMEDGDVANLSDNATVVAPNLMGTLAAASFIDSEINTTKKVGYIGNKRYVRVTMTPAGNTGASTMSVIAIQGAAALEPVA